jgi:UDP-N-acetyl-D-mannosaminuronic acid dehydrogenase
MISKICIIGLGRIGLPLALLLSKNYTVRGVEINLTQLEKIQKNNLNKNTQKEEMEYIDKFLNKTFFASNDLHNSIKQSDAVFIALGTGVGADGTPDLSPLYNLIDNICSEPNALSGKLLVLKSTVTIGTTRSLADKIEKKTNMKLGEDFFIAFCPERVLGDKAIYEMASLPKIIGAIDEKSRDLAVSIYEKLGGKIIISQNPEEAELIKLIDNSYRQTIFGFANDISLITEKLGINCYDLIKKANDNYPRNNIPLPSGGVSGYCLTKDPLYLETIFNDIAKERGFHSVWYSARKTNDYMPIHMADLLRKQLKDNGKSLNESNVLICGITYKENIDDTRFSHGLELVQILSKSGAKVDIWDPLIENGYKSPEDLEKILPYTDALVFTVKHKEFMELTKNDEIIKYLYKMRTPILIDGWGMFKDLKSREDIHYSGIGA